MKLTNELCKSQRTRRWCFTLNNYDNCDITAVKTKQCSYIIVGFEVGANGTPHMQGYVEFLNPTTLSAMKKWLPRAHFESAKGTAEENEKYCLKDKENATIPPIIRGEAQLVTMGGKRSKALNIPKMALLNLGCVCRRCQDAIRYGVPICGRWEIRYDTEGSFSQIRKPLPQSYECQPFYNGSNSWLQT